VDTPAPRLTIVDATPVLTAPEDKMTVSVTLDNTTVDPISGNINLRVANDAFGSREELNAWTGRGVEEATDDAWTVKAVTVKGLEAGQRQSFTIEVTAQEMYLGARPGEPGWGPRGILVAWETLARQSAAQARTYVVYAPPDVAEGTVRLSALAGLTAGPGETHEAAVERLETVATATADPWIAWMLDPSLLTTPENQDQSAVERLADAVEEAVAFGKPVYSLPYQDVDEAMMAAAGSASSQTVDACRTLSQTGLRESLGEETAAHIQGDVSWVARPVNRSQTQALGAAGATTVVLAPDQFSSPLTQAVHRVEAGPLVAVGDPYLTRAVTKTAAEPTGRLRENLLLADSAFAAVQSQVTGEAASLLVTLPRGWEPDSSATTALQTLEDAAWVTSTQFAALLNEPGGAAPDLTAAVDPPGPPAQDLTALLDRVSNGVAFASLTEQPEAYLDRSLPPLLVPLSNSTREGAARKEAAQTALADAATSLAPVQVVAGSEVNLISDDGMVPVVVENQSNVAVKGLVVRLTAQTHAIRVTDSAVLDLSPGQSVTARVPVRALANGVFDVRVDLLDQDGAAVTSAASMTMRVRAEWENIGTAVVGGLIVLIFVFGVISTLRKRRSGRRAAAADGEIERIVWDASGAASAEAGDAADGEIEAGAPGRHRAADAATERRPRG
jgi:hypothetical protein